MFMDWQNSYGEKPIIQKQHILNITSFKILVTFVIREGEYTALELMCKDGDKS